MRKHAAESHLTGGLSRLQLAPESGAADLRAAFDRERRIVPATFMLALIATWATAKTLPAGWFWLGLIGVTLIARYTFAAEAAQSRAPIPPADGRARLLAATHTLDLVLWSTLLLLIVPTAGGATPGAIITWAAATLLSGLVIGHWPRVWTMMAVVWGLVAIALVARTGAFLITAPLLLACVGWLAAVWWLCLPTSHALRANTREPSLGSGTRFGWRAALEVMPAPVLIVRNGRIADLNRPAAQFIGGEAQSLIGSPIEECLRPDPPGAFEPRAGARAQRVVNVVPAHRTFENVGQWTARVRFLQADRADSAVVIALLRPAVESPTVNRVAEDARRLAAWMGSSDASAWYRDERGRLIVPAEFAIEANAASDRAGVVGTAAPFPLAHLLADDDRRAEICAAFLACCSSGQLFDRVVALRDSAGEERRLRVVCLGRRHPGAAPAEVAQVPVIGVLIPLSAATEKLDKRVLDRATGSDPLSEILAQPRIESVSATDAEAPSHAKTDGDQPVPAPAWLARAPVLVWRIDRAGRVTILHGSDPRRWGLRDDLPPQPRWADAFIFHGDARGDILKALRGGLAGRQSIDVVNDRGTERGGRLVLRSHFVPIDDGVLVLDTIASPVRLAEIERLRRSKANYKSLVEASSNLIWSCDERFIINYASTRAARKIYGFEPNELIGRSLGVLFAPRVDQTAARQALAGLRHGGPLRDFEMVQRTKDDQQRVVSVNAMPLRFGDGTFAGAIGMNTDLTMLKQRERRLTEALRVERTVLDAAGQAIAVIKNNLVARCNEAFLNLLEARPGQLTRTPVGDWFATADEWPGLAAAADAERAVDRAAAREVQIRRGTRGGGSATAWCQATARSLAADEYVLVLADIDHIRLREEQALHHAHHDELTGLPNRRMLAVRAATALAASGLRNTQCAVMAIDLDGFKEINDRHGHQVGDTALREVAQRLSRALRPHDTVARRGGDEFAMLVPDIDSRAEIERIANRILLSIEQPLTLASGGTAQLSASLGIALAPEQGRDLEHLLQLADQAMYGAKDKGRRRYAFADPEQLAARSASPATLRAAQAS